MANSPWLEQHPARIGGWTVSTPRAPGSKEAVTHSCQSPAKPPTGSTRPFPAPGRPSSFVPEPISTRRAACSIWPCACTLPGCENVDAGSGDVEAGPDALVRAHHVQHRDRRWDARLTHQGALAVVAEGKRAMPGEEGVPATPG